MTEYNWAVLRQHAIEQFGETPSAHLEQDLLTHFHERPSLLAQLIDQIATDVRAGKVRSGFAILRRRLNDAATAPTATATDETERNRKIANAKRWIHNAGLYHETWDECATELFGDPVTTPPLEYLKALELKTRDRPGRHLYDRLLTASITRTTEHGPQPTPPDSSAKLYTLRNDQNARDLLHAEWIRHRPRGIQTERQEDEPSHSQPSSSPASPTPSSSDSSEDSQPSSPTHSSTDSATADDDIHFPPTKVTA